MENRNRILVADDERINRKVLSELLEENQEVILAKNGEQVLERMEKDTGIDLIILDIMMPGMDGYEVLKNLKELDQAKNIPVIFITSLSSVNDEEKGLRLGAADYIIKPFHPDIVKLRVENHLKFVHQRKLLETLVGRDGLTEISNRRRFDEVLKKEWNRAQRNGNDLSLIMIDVDCFKKYNDHYGHAYGDKVLKSVAKVLSSELKRPGDMVARYGGEEFVIILPEIEIEGARSLAEKLRVSIEALAIPHEDSDVLKCITVSMGGATLTYTDKLAGDLVEAADQMLYRAKSLGKNRVVWRND